MTKLPPETLVFFRDLIVASESTHSIPQVRDLARIYWLRWSHSGDTTFRLPGYAECPPDAGHGYPAGWSLQVFWKLHAEILAGRRNYFGPPVTTRTNHGALLHL